jgi:hypothetical protein
VLAKLNWDRIDESRLALLKGIIREHTSVLLRAMAKARDSGCAARGEPRGKRSASKAKRAARAPASY